MDVLRTHTRGWLLLPLILFGCSTPLLHTQSPFLELEEPSGSHYDYRSTSADGVVVAARALDVDADRGGDLQFWVDATTRQLRDRRGYALLEQVDVTTAQGLRGKQLRFGRDEKSRPYRYWLTVFVTDDKLYIIEAGGPAKRFEGHQESIERAIASLRSS